MRGRLYNTTYRCGEERNLHLFLWFPRCVGNEWRWLEPAIIRQRVVINYVYDRHGSFREYPEWEGIEWVNM